MAILKDERMKKQLLGLVVVVVVGLLLLPLFWSRPARREGSKTVEVTEPRIELPVEAAPPPDSFGAEMGQLPSGSSLAPPPQQPDTPRAPAQPSQQAPSWSPPPAPSVPRQQAPLTQPTPQARPAPAPPASRQAAPSAAASRGYAVQVAALGDAGKAHAMAVRLSEMGFPASVSPVRSGNKTLYRVRVGQVSSKAVAESLRQRLLESRGLRGQVVSNP